MEVYTREVERKFVIINFTYDEAFSILDLLSKVIAPSQVSYDLYWKAANVDFIRLRANSKELTIKVTDKTTILDRIEENVVVESIEDARKFTTLLYGPPCLKLSKEFSVFNFVISPVPDTHFEAILCLYQIEQDNKRRVFFEVEAESLKVVDMALQYLDTGFTLIAENRSLFQIFMEEAK